MYFMTIEQTVEIPANRRITLEVPRTVPVGKTILSFTPVPVSQTADISTGTTIEDIRRLLHKEMTEKGTLTVTAANGDGWETHVMEHYA
jgi:hypothetical protein